MIKSSLAISSVILAFTTLAGAEVIKPNIIFLFADDQSTNSVGCYGNDDVKTPHMDKLGADGMIFDRHYDTTAICMASRANAFTGMYEYKTGTNFSHGDMKPEVWGKSYPILLREAGYFTAFAGKFGMKVQGKGLCETDFDMWGGGPGQTSYTTKQNRSMKKYAGEFPHSTLSYGAFGRDAIREAIRLKKPLCLSISFKAPHMPAIPDPQFDDIYKDKVFTKPANYGREFAEHLSEQSKKGRQYDRFESWDYDKNYDGVMRIYHQQVYAIDVALGMIRKELDTQGVADNTVIIYSSDNGFICGSHGYGSKVLPMEESSRVPLMVYDPRIITAGKGLRSKMLTGNIDFAPTILELAGLPIPSNVDGKSLLPTLLNPKKGGHDQLALMNTYGNIPTTAMSVVTQRYKYTFWWFGNKNMEPTEELFDLQEDPHELVNLATDVTQAELLSAMRKRYDQQHTHLKTEGVDYNGYDRYRIVFDRNLSVEQKSLERAQKKK